MYMWPHSDKKIVSNRKVPYIVGIQKQFTDEHLAQIMLFQDREFVFVVTAILCSISLTTNFPATSVFKIVS